MAEHQPDFESIKRANILGQEYWSGRELMYVECSHTALKTQQEEDALSPHSQSYDGRASIPRNAECTT
jgi:hypothetical protein